MARNIKESFILKQEVTKKQLEELHKVLPKVFIQLDSSFHNTAELVNFYFYKMNEACVTYHSTFAKEKFPDFEADKDAYPLNSYQPLFF